TTTIDLSDETQTVDENTVATDTPVLSGTPIGVVSYAITGGTDQGLFSIDPATGEVTLPAQDFENPADSDGDNVYVVEVTGTDADGNQAVGTVT
ncbi:cadherin repeat domain-containing protein, partial [Tenacibaculum geojense]